MKTFSLPIFTVIFSALMGLKPTPVVGQDATLERVINRFETYGQVALQEKIFVHTDQETYLTGEILWFKLYLVDGLTHQALDLSKVVYLELFDQNQQAVLQAKIPMDAGLGDGSLYLPVSLQSGHYTLRAYTNWMKNFGDAVFFEKAITVINSFASPNFAASSLKTPDYDIQFFPEGGHLVAGLPNKVAVKVTAPDGKGRAFTGILLSPQGDTVRTFESVKFGMGQFELSPTDGTTYQAVFEIEGQTKRKALPTAENTGVVMHLEEVGQKLQLTVRANKNWGGNVAYLLAHRQQKRQAGATLRLVEGKAVFEMDKTSLDEGITCFTLFDQQLNPLAERMYFQPPNQQLTVKATTSQQEFGARQAVEVSLSADANGTPVPANLSMAVYRIDELPTIPSTDILAELWLGSDLKGHIESPEYYFSGNTAAHQQAADLLMLTHGWRRFEWGKILAEELVKFPHLPEYEGHIVHTKVSTFTGDDPARWILGYLAIPGKKRHFFSSSTTDRTNMLFVTKGVFGDHTVIIQPNTESDSLHRFELVPPYATTTPTSPLPQYTIDPEMENILLARSVGMQVQNVYKDSLVHQFIRTAYDTLPFFGVPDKVYYLDDYTRFPTMEEVMREYVPEVAVRKNKGQFHFRVLDVPDQEYMREDPLVLLDGIPVFDIDRIIASDPFKIKKLEVKARKFILNKSVFFGVVNYSTYDGNALSWFEPDEKALTVAYEGLQEKRQFYAPVYDTPEKVASRSPDFRQLLHWAPNLQIDSGKSATIRFFTADREGKYVGVIQGLATDGTAGSTTFSFEVADEKSN